jgi:ABC-type transport system involved in cytochrome bd biosynthesis fused ATPase/permease subunit
MFSGGVHFTMKEPEGWKTLLNYGAVIMFLTMPVIVMVIQLIALAYPNWLSQQLPQEEFKHLIEFQRALAILVFGLSGLRTWEVVHDHKNGKVKHEGS